MATNVTRVAEECSVFTVGCLIKDIDFEKSDLLPSSFKGEAFGQIFS